jgi:hypothetical protein
VSPRFSEAFAQLGSEDQETVREWLDGWKDLGEPEFAQVATNLQAEAALGVEQLREFLHEAARQFRNGGISFFTFNSVLCKPRHRLGRPLNPPQPQWVGRVEKLATYLYRRGKAEAGFSRESFAAELAIASAEANALSPQLDSETLLCAAVKAMLLEPESGSIFATFPEDRCSRPFEGELRKRGRAFALFGLGLFPSDAWALTVVYQPHAVGLSLHLPTICDAGSYHHFRPAPSESGGEPVCGRTHPLPGYDAGQGMPEAVHRDCGWFFLNLVRFV